MQEINEEMENDRSVLEWMLGQYVRAKRRKKQLEVRLLEINAERDSPIGGQGYDPLPRSGGNNEGAAGILMKLADIEDRIYEQKAKADKSMVNVATILNFLPEESMEREICELRHLDGHEWGEIAEGIPMSKSQCHRIHKAAMYELLEFNYVKELVAENRESYEYYIEKKEEARYRRENRARKNPEKFSGNFYAEKSGEKNSTSRSRKNKPEKIKPRTQGRKIKAKNSGKIQGENKGLFQKPLQEGRNKGPENKAQPHSPQGRPMHRGAHSPPTQGRPGGQDTGHTAHPHSTATKGTSRQGSPGTRGTAHRASERARQPRTQHTRGTAARAASQGTGHASDERCDSMHHLHVV